VRGLPSWSRGARRAGVGLLLAGAAGSPFPALRAGAAAQTPDTLPSPALAELSFRRVLDVDGVLTAYADSEPEPHEADTLLEALLGDAAEAPGETAYYWILHGVADSTWTLASRVHRPCRGSPPDGRLPDADRLTIVILMPQSPWTGEVPASARAARWGRAARGDPSDAALLPALRRPCTGRGSAASGRSPGVVDALTALEGRADLAFAPADTALRHAARAGAVLRQERSAASGFPAFLALLLGGLGSLAGDEGDRTLEGPAARVSVPAFDVALHATPVPFRDASLRAAVEVRRDSVDAAPEGASTTLGGLLRDPIDRARTRLLLGYVGYTPQVGAVFDALRAVFESPACPAPGGGGEPPTVACSHALQDALVRTVAGMDLNAEHRARAVQKGAQEALGAFETLLAAPARRREATFRVVERSRIGFSVGGLLEEDEADRLSFTVEDGQVVADGLEAEGFRSLALVDLYPWPVDLSGEPGLHPHLSIGFSVGEAFRPAAFGALPLCLPGVFCVLGRAALIGGLVLRSETDPAAEGSGGDAIDETLRARLAWGVKIALPVSP
jgi:hypothetical protein